MRKFTNNMGTFDEYEVYMMDTCGGPLVVVAQNDENGPLLEVEIDLASIPEVIAMLSRYVETDPFDPEHDDWREASEAESVAYHAGHWLPGLACRESEHGVEVRNA